MKLQKAVAEINLKALTHNLSIVKKKIRNKDILAVVKANAYGHGAVRVSKHLLKNGVSMLGVAFTDEAIELRESGVKAPILIFFNNSNIDTCLKYNLTPTVFNISTAKKISLAASRLNRVVPLHIKVDTGMGRVGFDIKKALGDIIRIAQLKNIILEGLMSHFSDADIEDKEFTELQLNSFKQLVKRLKEKKITFKYLHMANSAAVLTMPSTHLSMVRPGIMLYGYGLSDKDGLKPVMSLTSSILFLKDVPAGTPISYGRTFITKRRKSTIATIPIGYADGYSRRLSNIGEVIINGEKVPVVGRVCMDTIMADVTDVPDVKTGSKVILIGSRGEKRVTARDIADWTGTIPYEVLSLIGDRVKRVYK